MSSLALTEQTLGPDIVSFLSLANKSRLAQVAKSHDLSRRAHASLQDCQTLTEKGALCGLPTRERRQLWPSRCDEEVCATPAVCKREVNKLLLALEKLGREPTTFKLQPAAGRSIYDNPNLEPVDAKSAVQQHTVARLRSGSLQLPMSELAQLPYVNTYELDPQQSNTWYSTLGGGPLSTPQLADKLCEAKQQNFYYGFDPEYPQGYYAGGDIPEETKDYLPRTHRHVQIRELDVTGPESSPGLRGFRVHSDPEYASRLERRWLER